MLLNLMKRSLSPSRLSRLSSFTLLELLVVMGIIAVLAGVLLSTINGAIRAAQRAKAANMAANIQTAAMGYYTEYSVYPVPSTTTNDVYYSTNDVTDWKNLTWALCGNINPASVTTTVTPTVANTRGIAFLNVNRSDVDANGVPLNPISPTGSTSYFNITINSSYSGILGTNSPSNVMPNFSGTDRKSVV